MFKQISSQIVVVILSLIGAFYLHFAQAQDRSGTLQGVVRNSSEAPVSGAFVKLKNAERPLMFMVATQAQGRYTANNLPTGKYVLQAIGGDYQSELSASGRSSRPASHCGSVANGDAVAAAACSMAGQAAR
jgi:hypothetical protein